MKGFTVLALAAGASAQFSVFNNVADAIAKQVSGLDSAIKGYTSGDGKNVIAAASSVLDAINGGIKTAQGADDLTALADAFSLLPSYTPLAAQVSGVINDLISKKSLAFANGLGSTAEALLKQESAAAGSLEAVITGKLKGGAAAGIPIAKQTVIDPLNSALAKGVSAFASGPAPTKGSGGGSSAASSGASSVSSAVSSAASSAASSASSAVESTASSGGSPAVSSAPPQFSNAAAPLQVGGGLAAAVGALAYLL